MGSGVAVLDDDDVRRLPATAAVAAARRALVDSYRGSLVGAPRISAAAGDGELVFTVGGYGADGPVGFRVYGIGDHAAQQATLVWNDQRELTAVVTGDELGARRTGALGGVAADLLSRPDAEIVAIVGAGVQAWTQLWAVASVRSLREVRVFSRQRENRESFARRARAELGLPARAVDSAKAAAIDADIVVLATRSATPVIDDSWVRAGAHVTTVGPKTVSAYECPTQTPARAAVAVTDSPDQVGAYPQPCFTDRPLAHLGAVAAGDARGRTTRDDLTFYLSTGLAGSEVVLAATLVDWLRAGEPGTYPPIP